MSNLENLEKEVKENKDILREWLKHRIKFITTSLNDIERDGLYTTSQIQHLESQRELAMKLIVRLSGKKNKVETNKKPLDFHYLVEVILENVDQTRPQCAEWLKKVIEEYYVPKGEQE